MIFKNIEDLRSYVPVADNFDLKDLQAIINNDSEPILLQSILGTALLTTIQDKVNTAEGSVTGKLLELLKKCRYIIANHAFYQWVDFGRVTLTNGGIVVSLTDKIRSASENQIFGLRNKLEQNFSTGIDKLYQYLEANASDFPTWVASPEYSMQRQNFINSADEFNSYVYINSSRLLFQRLRSTMSDVEDTYLSPLLGSTFYAGLKTRVKAGTLTDDEKKLLPMINRVSARATMANAIPGLDLKLTQNGIQLTFISDEQDKKNVATPADAERIERFRKQCIEVRDANLLLLKNFLDQYNSLYTDYPYTAPPAADPNAPVDGMGKGIVMV